MVTLLSAAKQKSDQEIAKSDFYQTIFLPKIGPKADPNSLFWGQNQTFSKNLFLTLGKLTIIWKYSIFKEIFKYFLFCFMCKAEQVKIRLFGLFGPKCGLFRQKEDQFRSIFSERSAIRPRSDKADLHGNNPSLTWGTGSTWSWFRRRGPTNYGRRSWGGFFWSSRDGMWQIREH